jgi:hypothetical protein
MVEPLPATEAVANADEVKRIGQAVCDFLEREFPHAPDTQQGTRNCAVALVRMAAFMSVCTGIDLVKLAESEQRLVRETTTVNDKNELVAKHRAPPDGMAS